MPTYRELGGQDYYELLGDAMRQHWADYKTNAPASQQGQIQALEYFSTGYGARSKAKTLATPFNYSAGIPALKAAMGRATVEDVYSKIGSLIPLAKSNNKADFAKAYAEVSKNLSVLLGQKVNLPRTADGLVKFSLNPAQLNASLMWILRLVVLLQRLLLMRLLLTSLHLVMLIPVWLTQPLLWLTFVIMLLRLHY